MPFLHQFGEVFENPCRGSPNIVSLPAIRDNFDWFPFQDPRLFRPTGRVEKNFQGDSQESRNLPCTWPELVRIRYHTHEWNYEKASGHSIEIIQFPHHTHVFGINAYLLGSLAKCAGKEIRVCEIELAAWKDIGAAVHIRRRVASEQELAVVPDLLPGRSF